MAEIEAEDSALSVSWAELPVAGLQPGERINFTFRWRSGRRWERQDFEVAVAEP